jgi:type IV secretion system protein VirB1
MTLAPELLLTLSLSCAPMVHPQTTLKIVSHESNGNPYAIGINGPYKVSPQPSSKSQAIAVAKILLNAGASIDMGLAMINSANLKKLGLTVETVFDPCTNLQAMQTILSAAYAKAAKRHGPGQMALAEALSEYNTGNAVSGFHNGYVASVFRAQMPKNTPNLIFNLNNEENQ